MRVGQKIKNIHTNRVYTIVHIDSVDDGMEKIAVYEVSNEIFEIHRFNANYLKHYEVIDSEEE